MQITFERSGGFGGMRLMTSLDSHTLPPEQAQELERLVEAADFFSLPSQLTGTAGPYGTIGGADRFFYQVTVDEGDRQHTVEANESAIPTTLSPLIERLTALARNRPQLGA
jgi:hypothetical protein